VRNNDPHLPDPTTERSPELAQAEADVERARERVTQSVMALRNEVARRTDWREWIGRRPGTFLATAFVLGFAWGFRRGAAALYTKTHRRRSWR
jgi:hypothetical protein